MQRWKTVLPLLRQSPLCTNYSVVRIKRIVNKSSRKMLKHLIHSFSTNIKVKVDALKQFKSTRKSSMQRYFTTYNTSCSMECVSSDHNPELTAALTEMHTAASRAQIPPAPSRLRKLLMGSWVVWGFF